MALPVNVDSETTLFEHCFPSLKFQRVLVDGRPTSSNEDSQKRQQLSLGEESPTQNIQTRMHMTFIPILQQTAIPMHETKNQTMARKQQ
jgi:hypothetical protein